MQSPYKFSFHEASDTYEFITKNQIHYQVHFIPDYTLSSLTGTNDFDELYQIVIDKISDKTEPLDNRVFLTIEQIILQFFEATEKVLSYVCSDADGKQVLRFKKFDRWFKRSQFNQHLLKLDDSIYYEDMDVRIFISLMIHKKNPKLTKLKNAFDEIQGAIDAK